MFLRITISARILLSIFLAFIMEPIFTFGMNTLTTEPTKTALHPTTLPSRSHRRPRAYPANRARVFDYTAHKCPSSALERHRKKIVRLGVILPFHGPYEWRMNKVRPAVEFARDYVLKNTEMLPNYTIEFEYRDSACSEVMGPLEAIDMYTTSSVDVFLGPVCNYAIAPIARFSYYWGIPVLTGGALVDSMGNKKQYRLLTRLMGDYTKAGEFFLSVLKQFKYKKIGMLLHTHADLSKGRSKCWFQVEALFLVLKTRLNPDLHLKDVEFFDENRPPLNFENNLKALSQKCRGMFENTAAAFMGVSAFYVVYQRFCTF